MGRLGKEVICNPYGRLISIAAHTTSEKLLQLLLLVDIFIQTHTHIYIYMYSVLYVNTHTNV